MAEAKIDITRRLESAGLWEEGNAWRKGEKERLKKSGMVATEANEISWQMLGEKYPAGVKAVDPVLVTAVTSPPSDPDSEVFPWGNLPETADSAEEAKWVHGNYRRVVYRSPVTGRVILRWSRALSAPPSEGAADLMSWAAENRTAFNKEVWMKFAKPEEGAASEEDIRGEKRSIAEIERILGELEGE